MRGAPPWIPRPLAAPPRTRTTVHPPPDPNKQYRRPPCAPTFGFPRSPFASQLGSATAELDTKKTEARIPQGPVTIRAIVDTLTLRQWQRLHKGFQATLGWRGCWPELLSAECAHHSGSGGVRRYFFGRKPAPDAGYMPKKPALKKVRSADE